MRCWIAIMLVAFIPAIAVMPGFHAGLVTGDELSAYAGGHLGFPNLFTHNLYLHLPVNLYFADSLSAVSVSAHARYHFTGLQGFNLGGGLGLYSTLGNENSELDLGLEAVGGYTFATPVIAITPEVTVLVNNNLGFLLGCAFSF